MKKWKEGEVTLAYLKQAKSESDLKKLTLSGVKKAYLELASDYNKIVENDYLYCHKCNSFLSKGVFYTSSDFASGYFPVCKSCLLQMVEQRTNKDEPSRESKETVKKVLRFMNLPYIDKLYESSKESAMNGIGNTPKSPFLAYLIPIKSLPAYRGLTWDDSQFEPGTYSEDEEVKLNDATIRAGKKRFGYGFTNEDYMFLETEYQDWITRYECETKAQEESFQRLALKKWELRNATQKGMNTKDLDKTYQEWLGTANVQPRQNSLDTMSNAQTLGTLIQKYEETRPLPEIDPELQDVDKIGLYIDAFYRGHACKMLGLKNRFSNIYERIMSKYTVKPPEYDEEDESETIFEKVFGTKDE